MKTNYYQNIVHKIGRYIPLLFAFPLMSCAQSHPNMNNSKVLNEMKETNKIMVTSAITDTATFAAGCFWCVEEQFKQLDGVLSVISGYTGGTLANPTYKEVCSGRTGHAEACNVVFDPSKISFDELLAAFFMAHDPTQFNRQGNDRGTQYRSAIYYHNEDQKKLAEYYTKRLDDEKAYDNKIVTEVSPYKAFYKAEDYHQDYYDYNLEAPYCQMVIKPKLDKFKEVFKDKLKQK